MVQKQNLELIKEGSKRLETLKKERQALSEDLYHGLEKSEKLFNHMNIEKTAELDEGLTKLDQGLKHYGDYKLTIAELTEGLVSGLDEYVEFHAESQNYQGAEKLIRIFSKKKADNMRVRRLKNQSPTENLTQILSYGEQLHSEICQVREDAKITYSRLQANADVITGKVSEYEPREAELKQVLNAMEAKYNEINSRYDVADSQEQAALVEEKNELHKKLTEIRNEYDQVLTIYNQAQQAMKANEVSRDSFEQMVRDLGRQATMIQEKIDNVTEIYMAAPEAVKIMMTTKGMETLDKAVNVATDKSVTMITSAMRGVSDSTLAREEVQLIDETKMRELIQRMNKTREDFEKRLEKIQEQAYRSTKERYGMD